MSHLSLVLFGGFEARLDGQLITRFESARVRALLVYLAVENGRFHTRDELATLLWPNHSDRAAHDNLRQALANLRRAIGDKTADPPFLLISRDSVQWNPDSSYTLDTDTFTHLLATCKQHTHRHLQRCPTCVQKRETAVALYHGHFLEPFVSLSSQFEEWALLRRERWRQMALDTLFQLTAYHERQAAYEQAIAYASRQLELDPWYEEAHLQLMRLLARQGKRTAALAQYQTCAAILAQELDTEPTAVTKNTHEAIRNGRLPSLPATPIALPSFTTSFIGRAAEMAALSEWLGQPACRLLTLVGPGGTGKTRLAVAAAQAQTAVFPDGLFFIPLAELTTADTLPILLLNTFQLTPGPDPLAQLIAHLHAKEMLLILDNYEQLLPQVDTILQLMHHTTDICLLVTSREPLGLQSEWLFDVTGLDYQPDCIPEPASAVQLFLQRASHNNRFFSPTQEMSGLIHICQLVEGLPLAIELAAATTRERSCAQLAAEIANGHAQLAAQWPDVTPRHRSLWAVMEHSWHLLAPAEQLVLAQLALFRGGFQPEAALAIAHAPPDTLQLFVQKSLLRHEDNGRYTWHKLIRQYAAAQLQQSPAAECSNCRHLHYFLNLAATAEPHLNDSTQQTWLDCLEQELANLRAALTWGIAHDPPAALQLAGHLGHFWEIRGYYKEGGEWITAVLHHNPAPTPARAKALIWAGTLLANLNESAFQLCQQGLQLFQELGDEAGVAQALTHMGGLARGLSQAELATQLFAQSLAQWRKLGDKAEIAHALTNCAQMAREYLTDYALSESYLQESLALSCELNNTLQMAYAYNGLANLAARQGNYQQETRLLTQCLQLFQQLGAKSSLAWTYCNLGENAWYQHNLTLAYTHYQNGLTLFQELGSKRGTAITLYLLGQLAHHQDNLNQAITYYYQSLQISHAISFTHLVIRSMAGLGGAALYQGHFAKAARLLGAVYAQLDKLPPFLTPADRAEYDAFVHDTQQHLGTTFSTVWGEGAQLQWADIIDHYTTKPLCDLLHAL